MEDEVVQLREGSSVYVTIAVNAHVVDWVFKLDGVDFHKGVVGLEGHDEDFAGDG